MAFQQGQKILEDSSTHTTDLFEPATSSGSNSVTALLNPASSSSSSGGGSNSATGDDSVQFGLSNSIVSGSMPLIVKSRVKQESFIDALTAVMMGEVDLGDDDDDDGDHYSIGSISTIASHVKLLTNHEDPASKKEKGNTSLGVGKLFFYLEQKAAAKKLTPESISETVPETTLVAAIKARPRPPIGEISIIDSASSKNSNHSSLEGSELFNVRELVAKKAREADREGLFELGEAMFRRGELLLEQGNVEDARDTFERAAKFQKHSLRLIVKRMAESMHAQGLQHCDRGDKFLAVILLGVSEILKNRNSPAHIKLGAEIHQGYRKVCPEEREFLVLKGEMNEHMKLLQKESLPVARTLQAYAKCLASPPSKSVQATN